MFDAYSTIFFVFSLRVSKSKNDMLLNTILNTIVVYIIVKVYTHTCLLAENYFLHSITLLLYYLYYIHII